MHYCLLSIIELVRRSPIKSLYLSEKLTSKYRILFVTLGLLVLFLRCGIHPGGGVDMVLPAVMHFPKPVSVVSEGVLPIAFLKLLHVQTLGQWTLFFLAITLLFAVSILWLISGQEKKWRTLLLVGFIFSPVTFELLNNVGIGDIFTIIGWLLFLSRKKTFLWVAGIVIVSFTNTPQTPISVFMIFLYYLANHQEWLKIRLLSLASVSIPGYLAIEVWLRANHVTGFIDPSKSLINFLGDSAYQFFVHAPNSFFSCYGIFWIPILLYVFSASAKRRYLLFISLVVIPLFFAVVVVDATRVFTNLVFPIALLAISSYFKSLDANDLKKQELLWILFACSSPINWYGAGLFHKPFTGYMGILREILSHHSDCLLSNLTALQRDACLILKKF